MALTPEQREILEFVYILRNMQTHSLGCLIRSILVFCCALNVCGCFVRGVSGENI